MSKYLIILIFLLTLITFPNLALAQTSSTSTSIQSKLDALKIEIASKAAQIKSEISRKLQNRAFIGYLKHKSPNSLTVAARTGTKLINVNEFTLYLPDKKTSFKTITTDDYLVTLGDVDENGVLTAKKIIKLPPPKVAEKQLIWGQISSLGDGVISINTQTGKIKSFSLIVTPKIVARSSNNVAPSQLKVGQTVIVVAQKSDGAQLEQVSFIYINDLVLNPTPQASVSAKPASPSAKPKNPQP